MLKTLLQNILNEGYYKSNRNGYTYSTFSKMIKFDIKNNFPLLTTKKTFFKGIVEELLCSLVVQLIQKI